MARRRRSSTTSRLISKKNGANKYRAKRRSGVRLGMGPYMPHYKRSGKTIKYTGERKYNQLNCSEVQLQYGTGKIFDCIPWTKRGTGVQERIGIQVNAQKLTIKGLLRKTCGTATNAIPECASCVKLMVVLDKQNNQTSADITAVKDLQPNPTPDEQLIAFNNKMNSDRFVILKEKIIQMDRPTLAAFVTNYNPLTFQTLALGIVRPFKFVINLKGLPIKYQYQGSETQTAADIVQNNILLYATVAGQHDDNGGTGINIMAKSRMDFTDV